MRNTGLFSSTDSRSFEGAGVGVALVVGGGGVMVEIVVLSSHLT